MIERFFFDLCMYCLYKYTKFNVIYEDQLGYLFYKSPSGLSAKRIDLYGMCEILQKGVRYWLVIELFFPNCQALTPSFLLALTLQNRFCISIHHHQNNQRFRYKQRDLHQVYSYK